MTLRIVLDVGMHEVLVRSPEVSQPLAHAIAAGLVRLTWMCAKSQETTGTMSGSAQNLGEPWIVHRPDSFSDGHAPYETVCGDADVFVTNDVGLGRKLATENMQLEIWNIAKLLSYAASLSLSTNVAGG